MLDTPRDEIGVNKPRTEYNGIAVAKMKKPPGKECRLKKRDGLDVVEELLESLPVNKNNGWLGVAFFPRDCGQWFSGSSDPSRSYNARESQHSLHQWESFNNSGPWQGGNNPGKSSSSHNSWESANQGSYESVKKTMRWWINE